MLFFTGGFMGRQQEISKIAYDLYLQRGVSGDPFEDWVEAEKIYAKNNSNGSHSKDKTRKAKPTVQKNQLKVNKATRSTTIRRSTV
jgi:hypothetical protein